MRYARSSRQPLTNWADEGTGTPRADACRGGERCVSGAAVYRRLGLRAQFNGRNTCAHFTVCAKRPTASEQREPRRFSVDRRPGPRMKCGWGLRRTDPQGPVPHAPHYMPEAALAASDALARVGEFESQARTPGTPKNVSDGFPIEHLRAAGSLHACRTLLRPNNRFTL